MIPADGTTHACVQLRESVRVSAPSADLVVERLLRVIDEGRRTATYKLALLAALIDAVALTSGASTLPTRLIADRVLALYYPQTRVSSPTTALPGSYGRSR